MKNQHLAGSQVVVGKLGTLLVAAPLPLAIPFDLLGMSLAVLLPVAGMCLPPLARTVPPGLPLNRIGGDLVAVIIAMPLPLAGGTTANPLLRMVRNRLEELLYTASYTIAHREKV